MAQADAGSSPKPIKVKPKPDKPTIDLKGTSRRFFM